MWAGKTSTGVMSPRSPTESPVICLIEGRGAGERQREKGGEKPDHVGSEFVNASLPDGETE